MAFASTLTDDFGGGIYRGKRAPANAVYDAVNFLIDDESHLYKRGGDAYLSTSDAGTTLSWITAPYMPAPATDRILANSGATLYVLDGSNGPITTTVTIDAIQSRPATLGDFLVFLNTPITPILYAGSLKTAIYSTGTASVAVGSSTVTGSGTAWSANVDAGMIFDAGTTPGIYPGIVKSVDSNTQITLLRPWQDTALVGDPYNLHPYEPIVGPIGSLTTPLRAFIATAGAGLPRLLYGMGSRVYFTGRGDTVFSASNYHQLPEGATLTGIQSQGDGALVFTTAGVWRIDNLSLDPVDDFGNQQQSIERVADLILWDEFGIGGWSGVFVVPSVDDVYLFDGANAPVPVTGDAENERIRPLYRSYVEAGYQPGMGTVHRGHYFLPILSGTTKIDTLVCRLDRGHAWTRWSGHAASLGFLSKIGSSTRSPKLYGISGQRVTDLTGCFSPDSSNTTDADGTAPTVQWITRDYPTGQQPGFVAKMRARYELAATAIPYSLDRPDQDLDGGAWQADPFRALDGPVTITGHQYANGTGENGYASWLTSHEETVPLAVQCTIEARPATNLDAADYCALGFVQAPVIGSVPAGGYESRVRFESSNDTVTIERYDGSARTRIAGPVTLGSRIVPGDTFLFTVDAAGTISTLINGVSVATASSTTYFHAGQPGYIVVHITDQSTGGLQSAIRLASEGPTVTPEFSSDADAGAFSELTDRGEQGGDTGWSISDGSAYQWARVGKKRERIRFRATLSGAASSFVLRSLEVLTRPSGKQ